MDIVAKCPTRTQASQVEIGPVAQLSGGVHAYGSKEDS